MALPAPHLVALLPQRDTRRRRWRVASSPASRLAPIGSASHRGRLGRPARRPRKLANYPVGRELAGRLCASPPPPLQLNYRRADPDRSRESVSVQAHLALRFVCAAQPAQAAQDSLEDARRARMRAAGPRQLSGADHGRRASRARPNGARMTIGGHALIVLAVVGRGRSRVAPAGRLGGRSATSARRRAASRVPQNPNDTQTRTHAHMQHDGRKHI
jgi:hypothetical protein